MIALYLMQNKMINSFLNLDVASQVTSAEFVTLEHEISIMSSVLQAGRSLMYSSVDFDNSR